MSYSFLLKYIIIGDSGTFAIIKVSENLAYYFNILIRDIEKNIKSLLEFSLGRK